MAQFVVRLQFAIFSKHPANLAESMKSCILVNIYLKNRFGRVPKNLDQGPPLIWPKNDPKWPKTIKTLKILFSKCNFHQCSPIFTNFEGSPEVPKEGDP